MMRPSIPSPCIHVCTVEPKSQLCLGCGRSLPEIAQWSRFTPEEREAVTAELPARLKELEKVFE